MREYKFRGIDKVTGEWVYGYYTRNVFGDHTIVVQNCFVDGTVNSSTAIQVFPESVGQFTGWQDSENADLYEGDKIEIFWYDNDTTCETISYSEEYGYFMYGNNPICELKDPIKKFTVIGSVHTTPELLKQKV
jgi:hypothetical protein